MTRSPLLPAIAAVLFAASTIPKGLALEETRRLGESLSATVVEEIGSVNPAKNIFGGERNNEPPIVQPTAQTSTLGSTWWPVFARAKDREETHEENRRLASPSASTVVVEEIGEVDLVKKKSTSKEKEEATDVNEAKTPAAATSTLPEDDETLEHIRSWTDPASGAGRDETSLTPSEYALVRERLAQEFQAHKQNNEQNQRGLGIPPLRIFLMVGQSNTQGHGIVDKTDKTTGNSRAGTLEWMVRTMPETYGKLKTKDPSNQRRTAARNRLRSLGWLEKGHYTSADDWVARDDVYITYNRQPIERTGPESRQSGRLRPGFGGDSRKDRMGPELGFGWAVGDALRSSNSREESTSDGRENDVPTVLIAKIAWGGRSLAKNYRPPSSGGDIGPYYVGVLANLNATLHNLTELVPGYTPERGYELSGMAFHQGYTDMCDASFAAEYETNLAHFLADLRTDIGRPDLPVVIGVSGMLGWEPWNKPQGVDSVIDAQWAVANASRHPELSAVASVETRDFHRPNTTSPISQDYHWNGNCESYWLVGQAMGQAMVELMTQR